MNRSVTTSSNGVFLIAFEWEPDTAYMPSFAAPAFDYRSYEGIVLSKENIAHYIDRPMIGTCLNCMNYFVNREEYLKVWDGSIDPHTADSIFQNYNWLKAGNRIRIVKGLTYNHRIHEGSHYKNNHQKTGNLYEEIMQKLRELK